MKLKTIESARSHELLFAMTVAGVFLLMLAVIFADFYQSRPTTSETLIDWLPPSRIVTAEDNEKANLIVQRWIAWCSVVALFLSFLSVTFLLLTLREQRRSADATRLTFEHNLRSVAAQTRAYLYPDNVLVRELAANRPLIIDFKILNFGNSPALNLKYQSRIAFVDAVHFGKLRFYNEETVTVDILPQGHDIDVTEYTLDDDDNIQILDEGLFEAFKQFEVVLVAFGALSYRDIYGKRHLKTFCFELGYDEWRAEGQIEMVLSDTHNESSFRPV